MSRKKVIQANWSAGKDDFKNIESLKREFEKIGKGEIVINTKVGDVSMVTLDAEGTPVVFENIDSIDTKINTERERAEGAEAEIKETIINNEAATKESIAELKTSLDTETQRAKDAEGALGERLDNEITAREGGDSMLEAKIVTDTAAAKTGAIQESSKYADEKKAEAIKSANDYSDEKLSDANQYTDNAIKAVVGDGADEAFDTLKEIGEWIKTHSGETTDIISDINELKANSPKAGDGIIVSSGTISAKAADSTQEKKNFLSVSSDGILVDDIDAGATILDEDIRVIGLSGQLGAGNYKNNDVINKGTSLLEILKNILVKILYPKAATLPTAKITFSALPTTYEVGSIVSIPEISINGVDGRFNYPTESYTGVTAQGVVYSEKKLKTTLNSGFAGYKAIGELSSSPLAAQTGITVNDGANKISIHGELAYSAPSNNPTTNIGEATTQTGSTGTDNSATWAAGKATSDATITVTGYRNTFYGVTSSKETADSALIRTLTASNKSVSAGNTLKLATVQANNTDRMIIASPREISSVKNETATQDLTAILKKSMKKVNVFGNNGYAEAEYFVYDNIWAAPFGNETWIIKFA